MVREKKVKQSGAPFRVMGDHLIVETIPEDSELRTESGIVFAIPDSAQDKPCRGMVIAVGSGRHLPDGTLRKIDIHPGEKVLFSKYAGNVFSVADPKKGKIEYLSISYDDVLVVLNK